MSSELEEVKRLRMKEIDGMAQQIARYMGEELRRIVPTCINCLHWNGHDTCTKFRATPPPKVIAFGCEHFDDLPF